jgi:F-type H+-transporting ATPase subunit a
MRLGCGTKILVPVLIVIVALVVTGLLIGPIGSSLFHTTPPDFLNVHKPEIQLPSEPVAEVASFSITNTLIASWLTIITLGLLFFFSTRKMKIIPGRWQGFAELLVETIHNFIEGIAGQKYTRKLFPIVSTIFLYVITNAYMALIPIFGTIGIYEHGEHGDIFVPFLRAANTDINLPLSIAIIAVCYVEYLGFSSMGVPKYINTFFNFGALKNGFANLFKGRIKPAFSGIFMGLINLFIGFIEVISHFTRLISFTFRLFGNMTAGEILILVITFLLPFVVSDVFYVFELLFGLLQALIFSVLTLTFGMIALTPHEEH